MESGVRHLVHCFLSLSDVLTRIDMPLLEATKHRGSSPLLTDAEESLLPGFLHVRVQLLQFLTDLLDVGLATVAVADRPYFLSFENMLFLDEINRVSHLSIVELALWTSHRVQILAWEVELFAEVGMQLRLDVHLLVFSSLGDVPHVL